MRRLGLLLAWIELTILARAGDTARRPTLHIFTPTADCPSCDNIFSRLNVTSEGHRTQEVSCLRGVLGAGGGTICVILHLRVETHCPSNLLAAPCGTSMMPCVPVHRSRRDIGIRSGEYNALVFSKPCTIRDTLSVCTNNFFEFGVRVLRRTTC